jgi:hypothetical protein
MPAFEIIALDPAVPQLRAPGSADTYLAPRAFDIQPGTLITNIVALNVGATWNNAAITFTGLRFNATDTASNANSLLMDLQFGGASRFSVRKDGRVSFAAGSVTNPSVDISGATGTTQGFYCRGAFDIAVAIAGQDRLRIGPGLIRYLDSSQNQGVLIEAQQASIRFGPSEDAILIRDAANVLAQRNGTATQAFRVYNTFTDASNGEWGAMRWNSNVLEVGTFANGTGASRDLRLLSAFSMTAAASQLVLMNSALSVCAVLQTGTPAVARWIDQSGLAGVAYESVEMSADPAAPGANAGRLYFRDNGSGKTQLCVRFNTGAVQVIATEP